MMGGVGPPAAMYDRSMYGTLETNTIEVARYNFSIMDKFGNTFNNRFGKYSFNILC